MLVSLKATVWRHLIALCRELSNQVRWLSHDPPGVLGRSGEGKEQDGGLDVGGLVPGLRRQGCSHPGPGGGSWGQGWDTELSLRRMGPRSSWDWCEGGGWWGQTQPQSFRSGLGGGADSEGSSTPRVVGRCIGKEAAAALQLQVAWRGGVGERPLSHRTPRSSVTRLCGGGAGGVGILHSSAAALPQTCSHRQGLGRGLPCGMHLWGHQVTAKWVW